MGSGILGGILGLLAVFLLITSIGTIRRAKFLESRLNAICEADGIAAMRAEAGSSRKTLLEFMLLQFPLDSLTGQTYVAVAGSVLILLIRFIGWKLAAATGLVLVVGQFSVVRWHKKKEGQKFADGLVALLERVRRLVLVGNTFPQAFVEAVATADPTVKRHVEPAVRRIRHGAPFGESIEMLANQMDIIELHMLAAYVRTNAKFGGRVAHTLANLINQLGNKRRLEREIRAATAETRSSAAILFGLMVLTMALTSIMNPEHLQFFLDSDNGRYILAGIISWPLLGVLVMRKILVLDF